MKVPTPDFIRAYCLEARRSVGTIVLLISLYVGYEAWNTPNSQAIFGRINLAVHELGHLLFGVFGNDIIGAFGGTFTELLLPIFAIYMFWTQRDFLGMLFGGVWVSATLANISAYMSSDKDPFFHSAVPIWAQGIKLQHDWTFLFTELGVLAYYETIAAIVLLLASVLWVGTMILMGWMVWEIFHQEYLRDKYDEQSSMLRKEIAKARARNLFK